MPGMLLHQGALMNCAHQGLAAIPVPTQVRVKVNGMFAAVVTDQIVIAGCTVPPPATDVKVQWIQMSVRVKLGGRPALLQPLPTGPGAGTCVAGGVPPEVKLVQPRVKGI